MLGTVKMEGHETSDWNSYYADTQEVSESQGLPPLLPLGKGEGGPGGGLGVWRGAAIGGIGLPSGFCQRKRASPLPPPLKLARLPQGKHGFREPREEFEEDPERLRARREAWGGRGQPLISAKRRNRRLRRAQKRPVNSWLGAEDSPRCRPLAPSRQMAGGE